jgi:VWFA-related protein
VATGLLAGQQPSQPVFRTAVDLVQLDVRVVDEDGQFVRDLRQDEFRIFEDGVAQSIATFSLVDLPIAGSTAATLEGRRVESDVASNDDPANGRLYVIVMDDSETGSSSLRAPTVRAIAREFIERHLTDADRAAVVAMSGRKDVASEFTSNRKKLIEAVERFAAQYGPTPFERNSESGKFVSFDTRHFSMLSMKEIANWLSQVPGRSKAIVLVSERLGVGALADPFGNHLEGVEAAQDLRELIGATARANASVYILDPVGAPGGAFRGIKPVNLGDMSEFDVMRKAAMAEIAESTGGFALVASNDYAGAMDRIVAETSSYYLLGYTSSNVRKDDKLRHLRVEVTRPGLRVRARSGYVAASPKPPKRSTPGDIPPALAELVRSPLPVPGLSMQVSAVPFRGKGKTASVAVMVEARGQGLQFTERNNRLVGSAAVLITAATPGGRGAATQGDLALRLSPAVHASVITNGVRLLKRLDLNPGQYQMKIAAIDVGGGPRRGTVLYDLTVPDFSKGPVSLSGIALASAQASHTETTGSDQSWLKLIKTWPTARREFHRDDELRQYVEVYDNRRRPNHWIGVRVLVQRDSGTGVFERLETYDQNEKEFTATRPLVTGIPLREFEPGRYVLTVEAWSSLEPDKPVTREVPFTVR